MSKESPLGGARGPLARLQSERLGRLVASGLLTLPLLGNLIARALGFEVFYFTDPKLQAVWGTLAQVLAGWSLYGQALRHLRQGGAPLPFWLCLVSTALYGVGLYTAFGHMASGAPFVGSALLILIASLADYLEAKRKHQT